MNDTCRVIVDHTEEIRTIRAEADRLAKELTAMSQGVLSLAHSIASIAPTSKNREKAPGWMVYHPTVDELSEVRSFSLLKSVQDEHAPFFLPLHANIYVCVVAGAVEIRCDHLVYENLRATGSTHLQRGCIWSVASLEHPTTVLCVSYREVTRGEPGGALS
jgi:hypothetical protein